MNNEIIKFVNGDLQLDVTVSPDNETVWLTANQMAFLPMENWNERATRKKCVLLELSNLFHFILWI